MVSFLSVGCGSSKRGADKGFQSAGSENCSSQFEWDLGSVQRDSEQIYTTAELNVFERRVNRFEETYKDVTCKALSQEFLDANTTVVKWRRVISGIRGPGNTNPQPGNSRPGARKSK